MADPRPVLDTLADTLQQDFEASPPGPKNPHGNGFRTVETDLTSERKAIRCADPFKGRIWKIKNPESIHPVTGELSPAVATRGHEPSSKFPHS